MTQSASRFNTFVNILTAPKAALIELKQQPNFLFPLISILLISALAIGYYFTKVDFAWLIDHMVETQSVGKSPDEIEGMRKGLGAMSQTVMGISSIIGAILVTPIIYLLIALYLFLVNKILDSEAISFRSWFSLVCWTAIPVVFTGLASLVNVLLATDGQLALDSINPISFNNLFIHLIPSDPLFGPINNWDPMTIWSLALAVFGYSLWTQKSLIKSAVVVLAPTIIIYGTWIAVVLK